MMVQRVMWIRSLLIAGCCLGLWPGGFATACTTAVISGKATADGRPLLWKNRDTSSRHNEVFLISGGRYRVVAVVNAGNRRSVWMGVNEAGLCIENSLSKDLRTDEDTSAPKASGVKAPGMGNGALMKRILQTCATVGEVRALLESTDAVGRQTDGNFGVIDAQGGAALFEVGPRSFAMFDANDPQTAPHGYIVRSNFATTAQQLPPMPHPEQLGDLYSAKRFLQACRRLDEERESGISLKYVIRNLARDLSDPGGRPYPGSVNRPAGTLPETIATDQTISRTTTVSAAVFQGVQPGEDPALATMWVMLGDPKFSIATPCWAGMKEVADPLADDAGGEIGEIAITLRDWSLTASRDGVRTEHLSGFWKRVWHAEDALFDQTMAQLEQMRRRGVSQQQLTDAHLDAAGRAMAVMVGEVDDLKQQLFARAATVGEAVADTDSADTNSADGDLGPSSDIIVAASIDAVRVGVYVDRGVGRSLKDLVETLERLDNVEVVRFSADQIRQGALREVDVIVHPGGSGGGQGRHLGADGREQIREFVRGGGGFIGICAGAYLASSHYAWSLNLLDAKVFDRAHWARGNGPVKIALTPSGQHVLAVRESSVGIHYGQGPLLVPGGDPDLADYQTLAHYTTSIARNGAPATAMQGTTAIALGTFGRGRVLCFSPHPELTDGLESMVHRAVRVVLPTHRPVMAGASREQGQSNAN